jgi:hypothetical protein
MEGREESDQLPEEAPSDQVADDAADAGQDAAKDSAGVPGDEGKAAGHSDDG